MGEENVLPIVSLLILVLLLGSPVPPLWGRSATTPTLQEIPADLAQEPLVRLLGLMTNPNRKYRRRGYEELKRRHDPRAVPGLIELLRFPRMATYVEIEWLLQELTRENFGNNWFAWSEWLWQQESVELPPRFLEWKAAVLKLVDPAFSTFLYAGVPLRIRIEEIVWGGVKKDGIPALTQPKMLKVHDAGYLKGQDRVFGLEINGETRAYPLRIVGWHEMVNDVVGGKPVSLAYCTLCRSGILFDTTVEGKTFTFGSSGLLYRSNKLMYDHQTESLWMTIPGEPVSGSLAHSGIKLKVLPLVVTTWKAWRTKHPETLVLSLDTGYRRDYGPAVAYRDYFASPALMFPVAQQDERLKPKEEVFGLVVNKQPKAYVLERIRRDGILADTVGGENLVLITNPKSDAVRAYLRGEHEFRARKGSDVVIDTKDGSIWSVTEEALVSEVTGERLPRLAGHLAYWFGWYAFYPRTLLYTGKK